MKKKQVKTIASISILAWEAPMKTQTSTYFSLDFQKDVKKVEISQIKNFVKRRQLVLQLLDSDGIFA